VSTDGRILTNYHVIKDASSAIVKLPGGAFYDVEGVVAFDKTRDIAVIKAHGQDFRVVNLGDSDRLKVGEAVVAIGSPLSLEATVSNGIISGIRDIKEEGGKFLQVTAPISPGSSGGPLFNMAGEVVGITTLHLKDGENLNFAIPINDAKRLLSADAKVHDFPNETEEAAKSETHDGTVPIPPGATFTPPVPENPTTARAYYKQLYDAGGFFRSTPVTNSDGRSEVLRALNKHYVCFSDDQQSDDFFAFDAMAYDERYAKAYDALAVAGGTPPEKWQELSQIMDSIKQDVPYVSFVDDQFLSLLPSKFQTYLRRGERFLDLNVYEKGVNSGEQEFHWDGNIWVLQYVPDDPTAYVRKTETFRLSIEPATLRYNNSLSETITVGSGNTEARESQKLTSDSGVCEEIPPPDAIPSPPPGFVAVPPQ
jgi:Trypsin-like peptidase domain